MSFTQGLFWKNLPRKQHADRLTRAVIHLNEKTFFKDINTPLFLYTGTNSIDFSTFTKPPKLLNKLKKNPPSIFLYEPVSYYFQNHNDHILGYYSEFHSKYNFSKKLRADELDSIQDFAEKIGTNITVYGCDYKLNDYQGHNYPNLKLICNDIFLRQACLSYMDKVDYDRNITKKFWCGNGRYTIHRHIVMSYLADKLGNYSWHFKGNENWRESVNWLEDLPDLSKGVELLNNSNFSLDFKTDAVNLNESSGYYKPEGPFSSPNNEYRKTFLDSFVCIINETRFAQPTGNVSEKVIDAINYANPFVLVAPPRSLELLKKIGIRTFSDYWDESYDQEENHSKRMQMIFKIIDKINSMSIDELNKMYKTMIPILKHNREIISKYPTNPENIDE